MGVLKFILCFIILIAEVIMTWIGLISFYLAYENVNPERFWFYIAVGISSLICSYVTFTNIVSWSENEI